ncbi:MAG: hypothetical protein JWN44_4527 [Myxococcales bacterium]|nr:hypothetical protein [Myxococcales bacterium]
MDPGVAQLAETIARHLSEWRDSPAHVELAVFGSDEPHAIAEELDRFCRRELGGGVAGALFHQSSIGCVSGLVLDDGRRVVVKGHQPERSVEWLREVVRVQMHLASRGLWATTVCGGPATLGQGYAIVEAFVDGGVTRDAHEPVVRRALARGLLRMVAAARPLAAASTLRGQLLSDGPDALWPVPHSKLFDFGKTAAGARWIDDVAARARVIMRGAATGDLVIGHGDWRAEHVRFDAVDGDRIVAAFDWDSLCKEREPSLVGFCAHAFCADWSRAEAIAPAPTLDEARAFVADYEDARARPFTADERRLCAAAFAYACAYSARCAWALGSDERDRPGTFQALVARHGARLLEAR